MASSICLVTPTPSIKKAIKLINTLDDGKFPLLLSRIIQNLHNKDEPCFNSEEELKLQSSLNMDKDSLHLVLETLSFILEQAAYHISKPAVLHQQLKQLEMEDEKVEAVIQVWTSSAKKVIEKLRQRMLVPKQLDSVHWQLNLQMAQASHTKLKSPVAIFDLGIHDENANATEHLCMEFNHSELSEFFKQLEKIQSQLDSLR